MSRTGVSVLLAAAALALPVLVACGGERSGTPAAPAAFVRVASAEVPSAEGPGMARAGAFAAPATARAGDLEGSAAVAVPVAAPADRVAHASTLRELAWAAERAGDAALAADYRREAAVLLPPAAEVPAAKSSAAERSPTKRPAAKSTARKAAKSRAAPKRARGAPAARRGRASGAPRAPTVETPGASASRASSQTGAPAAAEPVPRRRVDRVFARVEGWLGGKRRVRRPSP